MKRIVSAIGMHFINRAAMGRARFLLCTLFFFFFRFVGEVTQTSTRPYSQWDNHATYDVYSPTVVKTLMYLKFHENSTLYLEQNIFPFYVIVAA